MSEKVPGGVEQVTPSWLSTVLNIKVSPSNFHVHNNVQQGSGFLSDMIRVECVDEESQEHLNLIVKLLPKDESMKALVTSEGMDRTEIGFYSKVMPHLIEIEPQLVKFLCGYYFGCMGEEGSVLILQDLKPQGYHTINFGGEETMEQLEEVVTFMTLFHSAGMRLEEVKGEGLDVHYPFLQGTSPSGQSLFYQMGKEGLKALEWILKDAQPSVLPEYQALIPHSQQMIEEVGAAGRKFPCLIHGDLWPNNLLFNSDPELHTKVIDWQLLGYKDPCYDLAVTLLSSLSKDQLTKANVEALLKLYYKGLVGQCDLQGKGHLITRSWDELSSFFYSWGMSYTLLWFLMAHEPFAADYTKLVRIYEFIAIDLQVPKFILSQVNKG